MKEFLHDILKEICNECYKKENKQLIEERFFEPFINYIIDKLYPYFVMTIFIIFLFLFLVVLIVIKV